MQKHSQFGISLTNIQRHRSLCPGITSVAKLQRQAHYTITSCFMAKARNCGNMPFYSGFCLVVIYHFKEGIK